MTCRWCGREVEDRIASCAECRTAWRERRRWAFDYAQRSHGAFGPNTYPHVIEAVQQIEREISVVDWRNGKRPEGYDGIE